MRKSHYTSDVLLSYVLRWNLGDEFARNTGYNEVGELNNIIILYPQASPTNATNPDGCWDAWGLTGSSYCKYHCLTQFCVVYILSL